MRVVVVETGGRPVGIGVWLAHEHDPWRPRSV
jgi:hypothetical protein